MPLGLAGEGESLLDKDDDEIAASNNPTKDLLGGGSFGSLLQSEEVHIVENEKEKQTEGIGEKDKESSRKIYKDEREHLHGRPRKRIGQMYITIFGRFPFPF